MKEIELSKITKVLPSAKNLLIEWEVPISLYKKMKRICLRDLPVYFGYGDVTNLKLRSKMIPKVVMRSCYKYQDHRRILISFVNLERDMLIFLMFKLLKDKELRKHEDDVKYFPKTNHSIYRLIHNILKLEEILPLTRNGATYSQKNIYAAVERIEKQLEKDQYLLTCTARLLTKNSIPEKVLSLQ